MDLLSIWLKEIKNSPHLIPLIKAKHLLVLLQIDKMKIHLEISNGEITVSEKLQKDEDVFIYSEGDSLYRLLKGEIKLREAMNKQLINVKGSLRSILFLESLFWLGAGSYREISSY